MIRLRRVITSIFTSVAPLHPIFVPAGDRLNPEFCAEPYPAENRCLSDDDYEGGLVATNRMHSSPAQRLKMWASRPGSNVRMGRGRSKDRPWASHIKESIS